MGGRQRLEFISLAPTPHLFFPFFCRAPTNDESRNSGAKKTKGKDKSNIPLRDGKKTFLGSFLRLRQQQRSMPKAKWAAKKVKAKSVFGSLIGARNTEGKTENVHMRKRPSSSHICFEQASNYLKASSSSSSSQRPPTRQRRHICAKTDKGSFFCQRR